MNKNIYVFKEDELLTDAELLNKLNNKLLGVSLNGLPLRTRSKVIKVLICEALEYDIPKSFIKTKPKFPCQNFDVYVQKSNNLQIWNDDIDINRRYILIKIDEIDVIRKIKIITGGDLLKLDTTGKLTIKYQAKIPNPITIHSTKDSTGLQFSENNNALNNIENFSPTDNPNNETFLSIEYLYNKLNDLKGMTINNQSLIQERTRADEAHRLVCSLLGYKDFHDNGQFPDIKNQLLEVKFQMSPTIDLGLHKPDENIDINIVFNNKKITTAMCRYLIITAHRNLDEKVCIDDYIIVSGENFFNIFTLFGGNLKNAKLQIILPTNFFD